MATPATEVDADGQPVRAGDPDRVIYPATDSTPEVTNLQVVEYDVAVGEAIMRSLLDRPTALEVMLDAPVFPVLVLHEVAPAGPLAGARGAGGMRLVAGKCLS